MGGFLCTSNDQGRDFSIELLLFVSSFLIIKFDDNIIDIICNYSFLINNL